jgi:hypothetical protein
MTTLLDSPSRIKDKKHIKSRLDNVRRFPAYMFILCTSSIIGAITSFISMNRMVDLAINDDVVFSGSSVMVTNPVVDFVAVLISIICFTVCAFIIVFIIVENATIPMLGQNTIFITAFGALICIIIGSSGITVLNSNEAGAPTIVSEENRDTLLVSVLGEGYETVEDDSVYKSADGVTYDFIKSVEDRTTTWTLEEVK